jgi:hypothetical protein
MTDPMEPRLDRVCASFTGAFPIIMAGGATCVYADETSSHACGRCASRPAPPGAIATPKKPNYDFERREREKNKAAEAAKKAQAKLDRKAAEQQAPQDSNPLDD